MSKRDKILDFIRRRFAEGNHWADGNCYWAAWILCDEFNLRIAYEPVIGHFVAEDMKHGVYYDAGGAYIPENRPLSLSWIHEHDIVWYRRLMSECRD